jgi:hypothetical protein
MEKSVSCCLFLAPRFITLWRAPADGTRCRATGCQIRFRPKALLPGNGMSDPFPAEGTRCQATGLQIRFRPKALVARQRDARSVSKDATCHQVSLMPATVNGRPQQDPLLPHRAYQ